MSNRRLQWIPVSVELTSNRARNELFIEADNELFVEADNELVVETLIELRPAHDPLLTVRDEMIFLLHTAAEVEHALMAQYLFAAWSIPIDDTVPINDAVAMHKIWQRNILLIARQEMGHLATVQNMLRALGGQLNFEREDYPFRSDFYPFHFRLEPLSISSLAKYVIAEMPENASIPPAQLQIIRDDAQAGNAETILNRVGSLYKQILDLLEKLDENDFMPHSKSYQAQGEHWFSEFDPSRPLNNQVVVSPITNKTEAHDAICKIAIQGEGMTACSEAIMLDSHFDKFFKIYGERKSEGTNEPVAPIAINPSTEKNRIPDAELEEGRITNLTTRRWAQLFNLRYRMLLADLSHYFHLAGDVFKDGAFTPRGFLRNRAFEEMSPSLSNIALQLVKMPLLQESIDDPPFAGPPFELDYTLALPDIELDRWRLHRDLISAAGFLADEIFDETGDRDDIIESLRIMDDEALIFIEGQINTLNQE